MNNKKIVAVVFAVVIALLLGFLSLPYVTLLQMKSAVEAHDSAALAEHVDFPSVRQGLKNQLTKSFEKKMNTQANDNPLMAIGAAFGGLFVEKMLEAYITPEGLAQIMLGEDPRGSRPAKIYGKPEKQRPLQNAELVYQSLSEFVVIVKEQDSNEDITLILRREGIRWMLSEVILPL